MSYDAGRIEPHFVSLSEAVPTGLDFDRESLDSPAFLHDRTREARRLAVERRSRKFRHVLPVLCALSAALVFATLTDGGRSARQTLPISSYLGSALAKVGLGLSEVTVIGQQNTSETAIYDRLRLNDARSVWLFDTEAARRRVETLPWVSQASLKRVFPDRLQVGIKEREPRAIWSDGTRSLLVDGTGRILGPATIGHFGDLPNVFGTGAAPHASTIVNAVASMPSLRDKVALYEWTANRRWTLHLNSGQRVLLPAARQAEALAQLTQGALGRRLIDGNFEQLDLRLAHQVAIDF